MRLLLFMILIGSYARAQMPSGTVLIVPYDPIMYRSMVDKELANGTKFHSKDIYQLMRDGVTRSLMREMGRQWTVREASIHDTIRDMELISFIHKNVSYEYVPISEEAGSSSEEAGLKGKFGKLKESFNAKRTDQSQPGARIENGEVVAYSDNREKFMNTVLLDPSLPTRVGEHLGVGSLFFVNQLDVEMVPGGGTMEDRQLTIHFTWMTKDGRVIKSGKLYSWYPSYEGNLDKMLEKHLPALASTLTEKLSFALTGE